MQAGLEAGKHGQHDILPVLIQLWLTAGSIAVLVDKPVTTTYEEAKELGEIAQRKQLVLYAFQNRRWDSDYLTLRKVLEKGSLGHVTDFVSQ